MSKPKIDEKVAGYELQWEEEKVKIAVSRLKQHRDNRITAWLVISSIDAKAPGLLHQAEFNLASTNTMKSLVSFMGGKIEKPWDQIIEQLRFNVLERVRRGESVMHLSTADEDIAPPTYLIHPWLPERQPTILFGEPGVNKSRVALLVYITLTLPWYDNPLGLVAPEESVPTLYCDWEADHQTIQWRAKTLQQGMKLGPFEVHYRRCTTRLADDIEQIQTAMEEVNARCLIVDSLTAATGGDIMKPELAQQFGESLRKLKTTSFIIAQTQKNPELKKKTILGSTIFEYYSRSLWEAKKAQTVGEDEVHVALHHRKANDSKLFKPMAYRFYFNENITTVSRESAKDVPEFLVDMGTEARVAEILKEGPMTATDVAEELGISQGSAATTLSRLKKKGNVVKLSNSKYGLAFYE